MNQSRGFITIATGKEEYYQLAANLVKSYRLHCQKALPFAILCDCENEYTDVFDDVILFSNEASGSYLDKLCLGDYLPYEETLFIDADCLAFGNLNILLSCFKEADDFSCFGRVLPLDDKTGWFEWEKLGTFKDKVSYVVGLHGGIYYMRKSQKVRDVFTTAKDLVDDYATFQFKGKFVKPGDEPLVALSMALNQVKPIEMQPGMICCFWDHENHIKIDICAPYAIDKTTSQNYILVHWGTRYTRELLYKKQVELLNILLSGNRVYCRTKACCLKYGCKFFIFKLDRTQKRIRSKLKRTLSKHR